MSLIKGELTAGGVHSVAVDSAGNLQAVLADLAVLLSGEDDQADRLMVETANEHLVIATATTVITTATAQKGYIHGVYNNTAKAAGDVLEIFDDNNQGSGGLTGRVFSIDLSTVGFKPIGCRTVNGIIVKTTLAGGASSDAVLIYRKLA